MRREYPLKLTFNGRSVARILVDSHYEVRHSESMSDELILKLIRSLDGYEVAPETVTVRGYEIVRIDPVYWEKRAYRLILTLPPEGQDDSDCLGVINAHRVNVRKNRKES